MYKPRDEHFFSKIERHFVFLHDSNYRATSRKVCLGPGTEIQVTAKLFCLKIGPPGTHMCRLKHAAACRGTRIFSKGLHMLAQDDILRTGTSPLEVQVRPQKLPPPTLHVQGLSWASSVTFPASHAFALLLSSQQSWHDSALYRHLARSLGDMHCHKCGHHRLAVSATCLGRSPPLGT